MSIGVNIRRYRKQAKLTQEELAKLVGVGRTSVTQWENGEQTPLMGNVQKLAGTATAGPTPRSSGASGPCSRS